MKVKLRDVSNIIMGQSPDSSTYNTEKIGLPFFQGNADFGELNPIAKTWCSAPIKIAYKNYILISVRAPIGALNIAAETCCIGRGLAAFDVNNKMCTQKYLWYLLKAKKNELLSKGTGSTFKAISKNILSEMEFNIPPVREQELCTKVLDVVFCLIRLKKEQLDKLDLLVKSRFIEMFGEISVNSKHWKESRLEDLIIGKASNGFFAKPDKYSNDGKIGVICVGDVVNRKYSNINNLRRINMDEVSFKKYKVTYGDMLFCRSSLVKEGIAKASIVPKNSENAVFECHVIRIKLNTSIIVPEYMQAFSTTDYFRNQMIRMSKTATMTTIGQKDIISSSVLVPPIDIQNQFVDFMAQVDKSKVVEVKYR